MPLRNILEAIRSKRQDEMLPDGRSVYEGIGPVPLGGSDREPESTAVPLGGNQPMPSNGVGPVPLGGPITQGQQVDDPSGYDAIVQPAFGEIRKNTGIVPQKQPLDVGAILQAEEEAKNRTYPAPEYYPNGVRKRPWDERLPDGSTLEEKYGPWWMRSDGDVKYGNGGNAVPYEDNPYRPGGAMGAPKAMPTSFPEDDPMTEAVEGSGAEYYGNIAPRSAERSAKPEKIADPYERQRQLGLYGASKNPWWKRMLQGALRGMGAGGLGGAIAGAAIEGIAPSINTKYKTKAALSEADAAIAREQKQREFETTDAYRRALTKTIPIDDKNKELQIQGQQNTAAANRKSQALGRLIRLQHFDPKNSAHKRLAQEAGLDEADLQGWDNRNPFTKVVAGTTYQYDRADQTFKPSNLPVDESATLTDYRVKMPNGEFQTFKVAQKDAARFATQMEVLGAQIEAAANRQASSQSHDVKMAGLRLEYQKKGDEYKAKLAEIKATNDQARKLQLQQEAAKIQQDAIRLRAEIDQ